MLETKAGFPPPLIGMAAAKRFGKRVIISQVPNPPMDHPVMYSRFVSILNSLMSESMRLMLAPAIGPSHQYWLRGHCGATTKHGYLAWFTGSAHDVAILHFII